jgi:hypothetical protein
MGSGVSKSSSGRTGQATKAKAASRRQVGIAVDRRRGPLQSRHQARTHVQLEDTKEVLWTFMNESLQNNEKVGEMVKQSCLRLLTVFSPL